MAARKVKLGAGGDASVTEDGETIAAPKEVLAIEIDIAEPKVPKVTRTQARAAANLRFSGAPYDEVARMMDYKDAAVARQVVEAHIAKAYPDESRESLFRLTAARFEQLLYRVWDRTQPTIPYRDDMGETVRGSDGELIMVDNPEQLAYVKTATDLMARQMKLHGLEAPTQVEITPNAEQFQQVVARMIGHVRADDAAEADVFEIEDIEDAELSDD